MNVDNFRACPRFPFRQNRMWCTVQIYYNYSHTITFLDEQNLFISMIEPIKHTKKNDELIDNHTRPHATRSISHAFNLARKWLWDEHRPHRRLKSWKPDCSSLPRRFRFRSVWNRLPTNGTAGTNLSSNCMSGFWDTANWLMVIKWSIEIARN